ncbi:SDR family oxidoreductase [Sandaracinus amylolyticus]|uniref:Dihydroflavonol-4-reductase n=1 Tax=Sandaracinus amylolyticus TaxID=927083 RepID=A0A0F6WAT9_9BACT|nr:SDR family oxidoreductase [Sandaracinus amylolyticus]AKF11727.1 Dihydroflavonol-4-reductase [Sandaracinus amylolyticus]
MRALVTGAAGLIGHHVVRQLCERGDDVRALVLARDDLRNLRGLDVEVRIGDVTDRDSVARAMREVEVVFHLAAIYALWTPDRGARMRRVNVEGTRIVLDEARRAGVRRVVHTSSIARFGGQGPGRRATESSPFALGVTKSAYAISKRDAHEVALDAARDQDVVIVAPCGPIGPGDVGPTPTGRLLVECLRLPVIAVTPTVTNFVDVRDVARGHLLAAERGARSESYLLGHRDLSLAQLAGMALEVTGRRAPIVEIPWRAARIAGRAMSALADRVTHRAPPITTEAIAIAELGLAADASRAVRELGLPQTPIERALSDALKWFDREGYLAARLAA